jgi:TonB family protein
MPEAWKDWEGEVVNGKFRLQRYLGGNETSAVFLTECGDSGEGKAAIKLIAAEPADASMILARWQRAARLSHPHLIRLFELGRWQRGDLGLLYVVMEYADEDLSQVLPERPLTAREARHMLEPTLGALAYLHGNNLVHGHLKPTNIMAVGNEVKVSSDGLYRSGEPASRRRSGIYDPPEIGNGGISPAADVWSLGVTLVEALTQNPPATEEAAAWGLPPPFDEMVRHCVVRDPRDRWTIASIEERLHSPAPSTHLESTRSPKRYILPAAVALALAGAVIGLKFTNRPTVPGSFPKEPSSQEIELPKAVVPPSPAKPKAEVKPPASNVVASEVLHQVVPEVPASARNTIRGTVRVSVKVQVDAGGNVKDARLESPGPSRYFAELARRAARDWRFAPAKVDGKDVPSEWILRFAFSKTEMTILPERTAP